MMPALLAFSAGSAILLLVFGARKRSTFSSVDADRPDTDVARWSNSLIISIVASCLVLFALLLLTLHSMVIALPLAIAFPPVGIWWFKRFTAARHEASISKQLIPAMTTILSTLVAGRQIDEALSAAAGRTSAPLSTELDMVVRNYREGVPLEKALGRAASALDNPEFSFFAQAVELHASRGGDLASVLAKIIADITSRIEMHADMRAKLQENKITKYILGAFPAVVIGMFAVGAPAQIQGLTHGTGLIFAGIAAALWAIGIMLANFLFYRVERSI